jgi:hypothetical protein
MWGTLMDGMENSKNAALVSTEDMEVMANI